MPYIIVLKFSSLVDLKVRSLVASSCCQRVICWPSSKVDQLLAHPPNNGAGLGDHDPAPNAPVADHLPRASWADAVVEVAVVVAEQMQ